MPPVRVSEGVIFYCFVTFSPSASYIPKKSKITKKLHTVLPRH